MPTILEVKSLCKAFGKLTAVNNVTFSVREGQCFGLLGPNGAGKTTTIEMMEGLIKADSGDVLFQGEHLDRAFFQKIGIQFQHTALMDYLKVGETLRLYASFYKNTMAEDELIHICALEDIWNQDARKLSGGQKQRLLLALALVNDPALVFLDEPTTGLDPQARRNFWQLIENIKQSNKTVLLTTHYMDEAQVLCDHIAIMDEGQVIKQGGPEVLLQQEFSGSWLSLPEANVPTDFKFSGQQQRSHGQHKFLTTQVEQLITSLLAKNISLDGLKVDNPNLEDLFIKLTGHELRS
jgi:ABC-2 type transport system ATP-binding protein